MVSNVNQVQHFNSNAFVLRQEQPRSLLVMFDSTLKRLQRFMAARSFPRKRRPARLLPVM